MVAAAASRTQMSCAIWSVMRAPRGRFISRKSCSTCSSSMIFRNGRLFKLDGHPLAQRPVEHRIAGGIGEVGEHQHIFVRERCGWRALLPEEEPARHQNERSSGNDPVLQHTIQSSRGGDVIGVRLQALEVDANVRRVLAAKMTILFDRLENDTLEPRWQLGPQSLAASAAWCAEWLPRSPQLVAPANAARPVAIS